MKNKKLLNHTLLTFCFLTSSATFSLDEFPDLPECGLIERLNKLRQGVNSLSEFNTGVKVLEEPFIDDEDPETVVKNVPLRFDGSDKPLLVMTNCLNKTYYLEVLADTPQGGRAQYQDDRGRIQEVLWNENRTVTHDSHPFHALFNLVVPTEYVSENIKTLEKMIGSTSTIIKRDGIGGIEEREGSLSSQLSRLNLLCSNIKNSLPESTSLELQNLKTSFYTALSLINNNLSLLDSRVNTITTNITNIQDVLEQILDFIKNTKIIVKCTNCCSNCSDPDD